MSIYPTTLASRNLTLGGVWQIGVDIYDEDGVAYTVAPVVTITLPGGTTTTALAESPLGTYWLAEYVVGTEGRYTARVVSALGVADFTVWVSAVVPGTAMPDITDVDTYMGDHSWTDNDLQDALDAEAAAQRRVCRVPAAYPDDLRQALLRRVKRNLSLRGLPLAVLTGDSEGGSMVLPGRDPEVRRFEAPYRKVVLG